MYWHILSVYHSGTLTSALSQVGDFTGECKRALSASLKIALFAFTP